MRVCIIILLFCASCAVDHASGSKDARMTASKPARAGDAASVILFGAGCYMVGRLRETREFDTE